MVGFASCLNEYAVHVSDASCSGHLNVSCASPDSAPPSIQNAVVCLYRTILSNQKQIPVTVTWFRNSLSQGLNIAIGEDPSSSLKLSTNSRLFRKLKGSKMIEFYSCKVEVFWDLSEARYLSGPEPTHGYYLFITFDSELGLVLGNMGWEATAKRVRSGATMGRFSLVARQEHISGNNLYSTRARFSDTGAAHDISIRCGVEKHPVLSVCIDKKMVTQVKRLQWNFRGNQTIFLDGLLVDLMWDVHNWFYNPESGFAVFMFRTRSGMDSRLWLEEKRAAQKEQDKAGFSFMIYACNNNSSKN